MKEAFIDRWSSFSVHLNIFCPKKNFSETYKHNRGSILNTNMLKISFDRIWSQYGKGKCLKKKDNSVKPTYRDQPWGYNIYPLLGLGPIKLTFGGKIEDTHISILRKIHNDSFHDKNARKNKWRQ